MKYNKVKVIELNYGYDIRINKKNRYIVKINFDDGVYKTNFFLDVTEEILSQNIKYNEENMSKLINSLPNEFEVDLYNSFKLSPNSLNQWIEKYKAN